MWVGGIFYGSGDDCSDQTRKRKENPEHAVQLTVIATKWLPCSAIHDQLSRGGVGGRWWLPRPGSVSWVTSFPGAPGKPPRNWAQSRGRRRCGGRRSTAPNALALDIFAVKPYSFLFQPSIIQTWSNYTDERVEKWTSIISISTDKRAAPVYKAGYLGICDSNHLLRRVTPPQELF